MNGNIFLRTSVIVFVLSMGFGAYLGSTQDFTYAPVHGHLNLIGGVLMFLAGLFYTSHPNLPPKLILAHYCVALTGLLLIIPGIYGAIAMAPWAAPVVGIGTVTTIVSALFFAFMVFKGTSKAKA